MQGLALPLDLRVRGPRRGQVAQMRSEQPPFRQAHLGDCQLHREGFAVCACAFDLDPFADNAGVPTRQVSREPVGMALAQMRIGAPSAFSTTAP